MEIAEWVSSLEPVEQGYVRQCFKFWNGTNGGREPDLPEGMSKAHADILKYHCKALNNGQKGHRKVEQTEPVSFRWPEEFKKVLAFEAAKLDITMNQYVIRCIVAGFPFVQANPEISAILKPENICKQ